MPKRQQYAIEKLAGVATNPVEGVAQDSPHTLIASFDAAGGYRPFPTAGSATFGPTGAYAWIGTGPDGWGAVNQSSTGAVQLFNGNTRTYTAGHSPGSAGVTAWIQGAGAMTPPDSSGTLLGYTYYDIDGNILPIGTWGGFMAMTATVSAGGSLPAGNYEVYAFAFAHTSVGKIFIDFQEDVTLPVTADDQIDVSITLSATSPNVTIDLYLYDPTTETVVFISTLQAESTPVTDSITDVPAARIAPIPSLGLITLHYKPGTTAVAHKRRVYGLKADYAINTFGGYGRSAKGTLSSIQQSYANLPPDTIVYSELGYADIAGESNWFQINSATGGLPTALASSPAGLLVFYEASTHLVRGDPGANNFQIQLLSGTIGADSQDAVATMGGVVFAVFQGEVYSISLGMGDVDFGQGINNISLPVFDPTREFTYLGVDYSRRQLVAHENSGRIFRYDIQTQQWLTDPLSGTALAHLVGTPSSNGVVYISGSTTHQVLSSSLSDIEVDFDALDLGDKNRLKTWRVVEVFTDADYAGAPTLAYDVDGDTGTLTGENQGEGRWSFYFPAGTIGYLADLNFTFPSVTSSTKVEPPIIIHYVPRYRRR